MTHRRFCCCDESTCCAGEPAACLTATVNGLVNSGDDCYSHYCPDFCGEEIYVGSTSTTPDNTYGITSHVSQWTEFCEWCGKACGGTAAYVANARNIVVYAGKDDTDGHHKVGACLYKRIQEEGLGGAEHYAKIIWEKDLDTVRPKCEDLDGMELPYKGVMGDLDICGASGSTVTLAVTAETGDCGNNPPVACLGAWNDHAVTGCVDDYHPDNCRVVVPDLVYKPTGTTIAGGIFVCGHVAPFNGGPSYLVNTGAGNWSIASVQVKFFPAGAYINYDKARVTVVVNTDAGHGFTEVVYWDVVGNPSPYFTRCDPYHETPTRYGWLWGGMRVGNFSCFPSGASWAFPFTPHFLGYFDDPGDSVVTPI